MRSTTKSRLRKISETLATKLEASEDEYLRERGADPLGVNRSLLVTTNHEDNGKVRRPSSPSLPFDPVVVIREAEDLVAFREGLTINTPMRTYFADDINIVPSGTAPEYKTRSRP